MKAIHTRSFVAVSALRLKMRPAYFLAGFSFFDSFEDESLDEESLLEESLLEESLLEESFDSLESFLSDEDLSSFEDSLAGDLPA